MLCPSVASDFLSLCLRDMMSESSGCLTRDSAPVSAVAHFMEVQSACIALWHFRTINGMSSHVLLAQHRCSSLIA